MTLSWALLSTFIGLLIKNDEKKDNELSYSSIIIQHRGEKSKNTKSFWASASHQSDSQWLLGLTIGYWAEGWCNQIG